MAIRVKKYCETCGAELKEEEELVYTCTEGIVEVRKGCFCTAHSRNQGYNDNPKKYFSEK